MVGALAVNNGTFYIGGTLGGGAGSVGGTGAITVLNGATLTVDDSVGLPIANRLDAAAGVRAMTLDGGTFNYIGSPIGNSSETIGAFTPGTGLSAINITAQSGESATITVASIGTVATGGHVGDQRHEPGHGRGRRHQRGRLSLPPPARRSSAPAD